MSTAEAVSQCVSAVCAAATIIAFFYFLTKGFE